MIKKRRKDRLALREALYRRRFLVPNAVTLANMFCGFLAIIYAGSYRFEKAAIAIGFAILLDGLDGRVARRLNATSKFGVEFDSFSDLVSFGIAPALLVYHWAFKISADEFGVFACFIFALCAASRLARFNISVENLKSFEGMPTPGAAGFVAAMVHFAPHIENGMVMVAVATGVMLCLAFLMVSKVEFLSVKALRVSKMHFVWRIFLGALIAFIWYNPSVGFLCLASIYCISGPFKELQKLIRRDSGSGEDDLATNSKSN